MTDRVLTDDEVQSLINDKWWFSKHSAAGEISLARAVEAATLAKCGERIAIENHGTKIIAVNGQPVVTEREARTRERTAFSAGARRHGAGVEWITEQINGYYPLPTVKRPRTVTLSDGTTVRMESDGTWFWSGVRKPFYATTPLVHAKTPADARLLADLVESPYEEVPE